MELVADANVLIDYAKTDPSVLTLYIKHLGPIYVPRVILDEVDQLNTADCENLGLTIVDEPLQILLSAIEQRGRLSFEDRVCLLLAQANQWTCITNEKPLHRACSQEEIGSIWELRLMIELVQVNQLDCKSAVEIAQAIHETNPRYITAEILKRFENEL